MRRILRLVALLQCSGIRPQRVHEGRVRSSHAAVLHGHRGCWPCGFVQLESRGGSRPPGQGLCRPGAGGHVQEGLAARGRRGLYGVRGSTAGRMHREPSDGHCQGPGGGCTGGNQLQAVRRDVVLCAARDRQAEDGGAPPLHGQLHDIRPLVRQHAKVHVRLRVLPVPHGALVAAQGSPHFAQRPRVLRPALVHEHRHRMQEVSGRFGRRRGAFWRGDGRFRSLMGFQTIVKGAGAQEAPVTLFCHDLDCERKTTGV
mmetsp:Transcript_3155/g.4959  ORF Transcript_3155/g.4959 Transcript_3155/m.4959 type:complete len:257 (+) Transcript_3155:588-1358(+)